MKEKRAECGKRQLIVSKLTCNFSGSFFIDFVVRYTLLKCIIFLSHSYDIFHSVWAQEKKTNSMSCDFRGELRPVWSDRGEQETPSGSPTAQQETPA